MRISAHAVTHADLTRLVRDAQEPERRQTVSDRVQSWEDSPAPVGPAATVRDPVAAMVWHLQEAAQIASRIGREDLVARMERLVRHVEGPKARNLVRNPLPLPPVGPVVDFAQWLADVHDALREFETEYLQAHEEDPQSFPLQRTGADWLSEFASRPQRSPQPDDLELPQDEVDRGPESIQ